MRQKGKDQNWLRNPSRELVFECQPRSPSLEQQVNIDDSLGERRLENHLKRGTHIKTKTAFATIHSILRKWVAPVRFAIATRYPFGQFERKGGLLDGRLPSGLLNYFKEQQTTKLFLAGMTFVLAADPVYFRTDPIDRGSCVLETRVISSKSSLA